MRRAVVAMLTGVLALTLGAAPTVTNVRASQRAGSKLVDIWYDVGNVSGGAATASVAVEAGGSPVNATSLSGDLGGIAAGSGKHIVWDVGADWNGQFSSSVRVQVTVADAPSGMALIPAGSFSMGNSFSGEGHLDEFFVHTVYVSAFYMDRTEVTKAKWDEVTAWAAANGYDLTTGGALGKASGHPAQILTWYRAVKWCNARSQKEGLTPCYTVSGATYKSGDSAPDCNWTASGYRLPTESEWERAARGGQSGKRFPWGDTINHNYANYYANSSANAYDTSPYTTYTYHPSYDDAPTPYTSPVGAFAANGYGLYDMAGNVWEWCWDWYGSTYYSSSPASDPRGPSSGSGRVMRGGSWINNAYHCRAASRLGYTPTYGGDVVGFRPVRRAQ